MREVHVYYIGDKPVKKDTVAGTDVEWDGYGSCRLVPESAAQKLLKFRQVWVSEKVWEEQYADQAPPADNDEPDTESTGKPAPAASTGLESAINPNPKNPPQATDKETLIKEAIRKLDRTNQDHFTGTGAPKIAAVREQLAEGTEVTPKELNAVFDQIKDEFRKEV